MPRRSARTFARRIAAGCVLVFVTIQGPTFGPFAGLAGMGRADDVIVLTPPEPAAPPAASPEPSRSTTSPADPTTQVAERLHDQMAEAPAAPATGTRSGETAPHETAANEEAPNETAPNETAPNETAPNETAPNETAPNETAPGNVPSVSGTSTVLPTSPLKTGSPTTLHPPTTPDALALALATSTAATAPARPENPVTTKKPSTTKKPPTTKKTPVPTGKPVIAAAATSPTTANGSTVKASGSPSPPVPTTLAPERATAQAPASTSVPGTTPPVAGDTTTNAAATNVAATIAPTASPVSTAVTSTTTSTITPAPTTTPAPTATAKPSGTSLSASAPPVDESYRALRLADGTWAIPTERLGGSAVLPLPAQKSTELELDVPPGMRVVKTDGDLDWIQTRAKVESSKGPTYTVSDSRLEIGPTESFYAISPDCNGTTEGSVANVRNLVTTLTGDATVPTTLAGFFPTVLDDLDIELPTRIDRNIAAAVLNTVSGISRGRDRTPRLHLVVPGEASVEGPFRRRIAFIASGSAQLRLRTSGSGQRMPVLEIRGSGDGIISSGRLAGKQQLIAFSVPAVRISPDLTYEKRGTSSDAFSFNAVASGRLEVEMNAPAVLNWAVHQADLGGHVEALRITVVGRAQSVGRDLPLEVRLLLDGRPVGSTKLDGGGPFEIEAAVPFKDRSFSLRRESTLRIEARIVDQKVQPTVTGCEPAQPVQIIVDGEASSVKATLGTSKLQGFDRYPQALAKGVTVRLSNSSPEELVGSARVIASLWTGRGKTFDPEIVVEPISTRTDPDPRSKKLPLVFVMDPSTATRDVPNVTLDGVGGVSSDVFNDATLASRVDNNRDQLDVAIGNQEANLEDVLNVSSFATLDGDLAVVTDGSVKAVWTSRTPQTGSVAADTKPVARITNNFSRFRSLLVGIVMSLTLVLVAITVRTVLKAARHMFRRPRRTQT